MVLGAQGVWPCLSVPKTVASRALTPQAGSAPPLSPPASCHSSLFLGACPCSILFLRGGDRKDPGLFPRDEGVASFSGVSVHRGPRLNKRDPEKRVQRAAGVATDRRERGSHSGHVGSGSLWGGCRQAGTGRLVESSEQRGGVGAAARKAQARHRAGGGVSVRSAWVCVRGGGMAQRSPMLGAQFYAPHSSGWVPHKTVCSPKKHFLLRSAGAFRRTCSHPAASTR